MLSIMKPEFVCTDCAVAAGGKMPEGHVATWHEGECGVCHQVKAVTQPRDFGNPFSGDAESD